MTVRPRTHIEESEPQTRRITVIGILLAIGFMVISGRLFFIQVIAHEKYKTLADKQHLRVQDYTAQRGEIFAYDRAASEDKTLYPVSTNKLFYEVYLNPNEITRPINTAEALRDILDVEYEDILARAKKENDEYEPVVSRATEEQVAQIEATGLTGIYFKEHAWRYYPDGIVGSHILGFYGIEGDRKVGKYGIEGYWEKELSGINHEVIVARDGLGSIIPESDDYFNVAVDGSDIILTIDRTIQFEACQKLAETVERFAADEGSLIIMEPSTGRIRAMCNVPAFDPNNYGDIDDVSWFNNDAVFEAYEPGSVIKPISMSIAIDQGKVDPSTTYEDTGEVEISDFIIRNFDKKAHGLKTMTEVLAESLNLGVIFATKEVSNSTFYEYMQKYGFGELTGIDISQEQPGSLGKLSSLEDIYKATASYGQGISATPLQVLTAINTIANNGVLVKPFIVDEIRKSNGAVIKTAPEEVRRVISKETAQTVSAMLVRVLEGYGEKAQVENYFLAGKTGTAQIAEAGGYGEKTNHTFVGFGPANNPQFSIIIKMHNVKNVKFAADSTTGLFGELAQFLVNYYKIPPSR